MLLLYTPVDLHELIVTHTSESTSPMRGEEEETHLLLIEPTGTPNTGDEATVAPQQSI
jgi:hypothetical protein